MTFLDTKLHMEKEERNGASSPDAEHRVIGLTGGIGSGKSTVAEIIIQNGFPVYNSDYWAKELVNESDDVRAKIISLLGEEAYDQNGFYDRKFVSNKVFDNDELLQNLNSIIHPAVKNHFEKWVDAQASPLVFKETALLFELKLNQQCHKTVLVTAEDNIRMKRVMERDGKTYREVEAIMSKQMPEKDKSKLADFIIINNGNLENLAEETHRVLQLLNTV